MLKNNYLPENVVEEEVWRGGHVWQHVEGEWEGGGVGGGVALPLQLQALAVHTPALLVFLEPDLPHPADLAETGPLHLPAHWLLSHCRHQSAQAKTTIVLWWHFSFGLVHNCYT